MRQASFTLSACMCVVCCAYGGKDCAEAEKPRCAELLVFYWGALFVRVYMVCVRMCIFVCLCVRVCMCACATVFSCCIMHCRSDADKCPRCIHRKAAFFGACP